MHGMSLADDRCDQVAAHQVARCQVKLAKSLVLQLGRRHPGVEPECPERFTLIDVADARAYPLFQQQLSEGGRLGAAGAQEDLIQIEWIDQDIRSKVSDRRLGVANQLHDWRGEADRDDIVETQHRGGAPLGLAPALTRAIQVP